MKLHRALRVLRGQLRLVLVRQFLLEHAVAFDQRQRRISSGLRLGMQRPHVVRVRQAEVFVEAVVRRQELRGPAEVPLARHSGRVTFLLHEFRERHLAVGDAVLRRGSERAVNADPIRVTAREQRRTRRGAHRLRYVEIGELAAFLSEAIEVRSRESFCAEHSDIGVTLIVGENDDDVRQPRFQRAAETPQRKSRGRPQRGEGKSGASRDQARGCFRRKGECAGAIAAIRKGDQLQCRPGCCPGGTIRN